MAQSKILDSNINQRSQVGREIINEKNATSFMRKYELFDRADLFPKEIRTMEIKEWESFARQNPSGHLLRHLELNEYAMVTRCAL